MRHYGLAIGAILTLVVAALASAEPDPLRVVAPSGALLQGSPLASPQILSPTPTPDLLATIQTQATTSVVVGSTATVSALQTRVADLESGLALLATREAASAQAVAAAQAQATAAQATISALSTQVADLQATVNAVPTATPSPVPTSTPIPTPSPLPQAGSVLYQSDAEGNTLAQWLASQDWKILDGMIVNDGTNTNHDAWIAAPYALGEISNYAVEAQIQLVKQGNGYPGFGFVVRATDAGAYWVGVTCGSDLAVISLGFEGNGCFNQSASADLRLDGEWHTYRVEVQGNRIRLLIDGGLVVEATDNTHLTGGKVGLFSFEDQINVRGFTVIAL